MKKWFLRLLGQRNIGRQWGMIAQTAGQISIFVSMFNLLLIAATAYSTTLSPWLQEHGMSISFWVFMVVIVGVLIILFALMWKFALPSYYSSFNEQFYRHDNPIRTELEKIEKMLGEKVGGLEERVKKLEKKGGGR